MTTLVGKGSTHLAEVEAAEARAEEMAAERRRAHEKAMESLGFGGGGGKDIKPTKLRRVLKDSGVSLYPLSALGLLTMVDNLQGYAFTVLTPEISRAMGVGAGTIAFLIALKTLAMVVSPLPMAALVQRHPRRALIIIVTGGGWAVATLYTGFANSLWVLAFVLILDGLTTGSVGPLHQPLLMDTYPPAARVRVISAYNAANVLGNVAAPLAVALLAGALGFTWRGVFVAFGIACIAVVPFTLRLKDPGFGRWDTQVVRQTVSDEATSKLSEVDVSLGFFEIVRRVMMIPTIRSLMVASAVFGMLLVPFAVFLSFYLDETLNFDAGQRGIFFGATSVCSIVGLLAFGVRGEAWFRKDPSLLVRYAAVSLCSGILVICIAVFIPYTPVVVALFILANVLISLMGPALGIVVMSVVPSHMRPHTAALQGIFIGGVGGLAGAALLGGMASRYGTTGAMLGTAIPAVIGAILMVRASRFVNDDLGRMIDEVIQDEQLANLHRTGGHVPLLSCKNINFSYGQLQVLFNVDFTVDDGEMVALMGTNGAGKSTLLKVISGIGLPQMGAIRFRGQDITYLDAERRTRLGITQVPGGRAVFGPLNVVDNLRSFGYGLGKERRHLNSLIDECFEAFPRLYERRDSLASQLSGGEQQMLGVAKALILRPKLLIIDELSLGLAPIIVGQLLDMVRRINDTGTAVVLVEQSVNVALSLVDHAYFMEKGEMRFDGAAADLLSRDDLLRAVFLEGAGAAT